MSILSFPVRGPEGDARYHGNCAGQVYTYLIRETRSDSLLDVTLGSGTGVEVALNAGLRAGGADLRDDLYLRGVAGKLRRRGADVRTGFDSARTDLEAAFGTYGLVFSHPPYATMVRYSGDARCLSQQGDDEAFFAAMQAMTLNMRAATRVGGHYAVLIGDLRRNGVLTSLQAEVLARMPRREVRAVCVKVQHNVRSGSQAYGHVRFGPVEHETLLIWERTPGGRYETLAVISRQDSGRAQATWTNVVLAALSRQGGEATLSALYAEVYDAAPERVGSSPHWQAKVRQTLQRAPGVTPGRDHGTWKLAS